MPRFVILEHDYPFLHWDFMLEFGEVLRTWRLASPPDAGRIVPAEPLGDHRLHYLDYEGPLSRERGVVVRWDAGNFEVKEKSPDRVIVALQGTRCRGTAMLARIAAGWQLAFHPAGRA